MDRLPYDACRETYAALGFEFNGPEQSAPVLTQDRFPCIFGGERSGKSYAAEKILLPHVLALPYAKPDSFFLPSGKPRFDPRIHKPHNPHFVLYGPTYTESRIEFEYLEEDLRRLGKLIEGKTSKPKDGAWMLVTQEGVVVQTLSTEIVDSIRAINPEGVLVTEAGGHQKAAIDRIRGRVAATKGFIVYVGCLRGDSLVATSKGLLSLEEFGWVESPVGATVRGQKGFGTVEQWHHNGVFPTKRVKFAYGLELEGTLNHKVLVRSTTGGTGGLRWKQLDELAVGDRAAISLDVGLFGNNHLPLDDAYLAGLYLGDGCCEVLKGTASRGPTRKSHGRVTITCGPDETETQAFLAARGFIPQGAYHWRSSHASNAIYRAGVDLSWKAGDKELPLFIRMAERGTVAAFLSGLFDADGCAQKEGHITLSSKSRRLLEQVQSMLLNFGLLAGIAEKNQRASLGGRPMQDYAGFTLTLSAGAEFQEKIGFRLSRKAERCIAGGKRQRLRSHQAAYGFRIGGRVWGEYAFATVRAIDDGECDTFDLSVPDGRSYTANGIVVHNTLEKTQQWWKEWQLIGNRPNELGIKSYVIPSWSNRIEFPGGREDPEIKQWWASLALTDPDLPLERLAAISRPLRERVVSEATEAHILEMEIPEDARHEVWIDPGYASAYAVVFVALWERNGKPFFYCYDELYEQRQNTEQIIALCRRKPTWPKIDPGEGVIDIASKGHRDATQSALEIWEKKTEINFSKKFWHEDRQRERLQNCFRTNQIALNPRCRGFIAELGLGEPVFPEMHPWKYSTDRDGRIRSEKPIDRWNHSVKAAAYGLLHHLGQVEDKRKPSSRNRILEAARVAPRDVYKGSPWS